MTSNITNPMLELADRYADELSAQFRTLSFFVNHAGEVGRTHEAYLRDVIARFLPAKCGVGTGFVASPNWISFQQDIIIYNQIDFPLLFKAGDCIVVDYDAVAALLEVKTSLNSKDGFAEAYEKLADLYAQVSHSRFVGLYAWEGLNLNSALSEIWDCVRRNPTENFHKMPSAIYVRSKYLLLLNADGRRETPPLLLLDIASGNVTEGQAILSLISVIWIERLQNHAGWPWWLNNWQSRIPQIATPVPWPSDLLATINASLGSS
jgi:hypothetical protein